MDSLLVEILRQITELRDEFREYKDRNDQRMRALLLTMQAERKDAAEHRRSSSSATTVPPPAPQPSPSTSAPSSPAGVLSRSLAAHVAAGGWPATIAILVIAFPFVLVIVAAVAWATDTSLPAIITAFTPAIGAFDHASPP